MLKSATYPYDTVNSKDFLDRDFGCHFHFNGQETDDEIAGMGNIMTAEFWEYDTRLGRRWNVDPITKPWESVYAVFSNNPIVYVDPSGLTSEEPKMKKGEDGVMTQKNGKPFPLKEVVIRPKPLENAECTSEPTPAPPVNKPSEDNEGKIREYRSYGWSVEENNAVCKFMLGGCATAISGGLVGVFGAGAGYFGRGAVNSSYDALSQYTANGFDASKINATSVVAAGLLPTTFGGHAFKNLISAGAIVNLGGNVSIYGVTHQDLSFVMATASIGLVFDRGGAYLEGLAKVNSPYLTRLYSLSYKPKLALQLTKYETGLGVGSFFSNFGGKVGLGATGNALQNLNEPK